MVGKRFGKGERFSFLPQFCVENEHLVLSPHSNEALGFVEIDSYGWLLNISLLSFETNAHLYQV